ncbi:class I SAM-dependent methyltransferase [Mycobacterium intracellulare]|uniref:SAM-dependent methyltransferase n=1 Tax=Mycobacterium intracellulare TaxID=1767 RepID=UPI001CD97A9C|nr:class I SAM-dependent methyltransferase [Mycobacterium intracellulare]MCA2306429.1 class I SAM-dependent methyltransferase [Mycobacterium intracellulare]MCA2348777.1 class I SAM-dependent methyltransferase [Mycobacterium intracellulare]
MRSDGDTWDITTSVGSTALFVAAARALEARKPTPLAVDQYAEAFCRAAGGEWAQLADGAFRDHKLHTADFGEYFVNYQGARTKYFDDFCDGAIRSGVRQVVIPAAGLDSRAYRLRWHPDTIVFELDQPLVHQFKRKVLAERDVSARATRREIAVDLRGDWGKTLQDNGFDSARPTAWLVEGLSMYLPGDALEQIFRTISGLSAPGSLAAIEQVATHPDVVLDRMSTDAAERGDASDSKFLSLIYNQRRDEAATWFHCHGWDVERTELLDLLNANERPVPPIPGHAWFMFSALSLVTAVKA